MNLSSVLLVLIIALVGLGGIGYDDLHTHQELEALNAQIAQDQATIASLNNQITELKNTLAQAGSDNASLQQQIDADATRITELENQIAQLNQQAISSTRNSAASTPAQAASLSQPASSSGAAAGLPGGSLNWALLSPVLLIPLVLVTLKVAQNKKSLTGYSVPQPLLGMEVKSYRAILTKDEMDQVILSRRSRQISK